MLARRFTIVCLLVTLFGMGMAMLVAGASRPARSLDIGTSLPCVLDSALRCSAPVRR